MEKRENAVEALQDVGSSMQESIDKLMDHISELKKLRNADDEEMKSNIFKYLLNQMEQNHSFEIKTAILKSLCQMKQPSLSSDLLELLRTTPEQILPILVKNAREIPNDLENKGEVMTEMCLYWLAYMEHGHSGNFF